MKHRLGPKLFWQQILVLCSSTNWTHFSNSLCGFSRFKCKRNFEYLEICQLNPQHSKWTNCVWWNLTILMCTPCLVSIVVIGVHGIMGNGAFFPLIIMDRSCWFILQYETWPCNLYNAIFLIWSFLWGIITNETWSGGAFVTWKWAYHNCRIMVSRWLVVSWSNGYKDATNASAIITYVSKTPLCTCWITIFQKNGGM